MGAGRMFKKGGVFAGGWAAFRREGNLGVKAGELQDGSLSGPRRGNPGPGGALALSGEERISGGEGGGLREPMTREEECLF